jgi:hypothetical protein
MTRRELDGEPATAGDIALAAMLAASLVILVAGWVVVLTKVAWWLIGGLVWLAF